MTMTTTQRMLYSLLPGNCQRDRQELGLAAKTHSLWGFLTNSADEFVNPLWAWLSSCSCSFDFFIAIHSLGPFFSCGNSHTAQVRSLPAPGAAPAQPVSSEHSLLERALLQVWGEPSLLSSLLLSLDPEQGILQILPKTVLYICQFGEGTKVFCFAILKLKQHKC